MKNNKKTAAKILPHESLDNLVLRQMLSEYPHFQPVGEYDIVEHLAEILKQLNAYRDLTTKLNQVRYDINKILIDSKPEKFQKKAIWD